MCLVARGTFGVTCGPRSVPRAEICKWAAKAFGSHPRLQVCALPSVTEVFGRTP